jgi:nucleoside-diphosphate kinase
MAETAHMVVFIKPDKVHHRLVDVTIARFERHGTRLVVLNTVQPTRELAACHYAVHQDKPFFESMVNIITSEPVVVMVLEYLNTAETVHQINMNMQDMKR